LHTVPDGGPDIGLCRFAKPSLEHEWPGTGRRSGSKLSLLAGRALRWLWERLEKRWNLQIEGSGAAREAECDTTGS